MNEVSFVEIDVTFTPQDENDENETFTAVESGAPGAIRRVEERGLTGVEIALIGLVSIQAFAAIITRLSRQWHAGVIVDARGSKVRTTRDATVPRGVVIMIRNDGVRTEMHEPQDEQLLSTIVAQLTRAG
jgi:hypothetical protein